MSRLIRGLMAALLAAPMAAVAVVGTAGPANAEDNGVGQTPAMGWSSWSFVRHDPTAATIEAQADALHTSGLQQVGFSYVNIDDFYYECPGGQGPNVDQYGRWVTDPAKFPPSAGGANGIAVVADYVHKLGLKFGIYVTPGISKQAVAQNTAIEGTPYHADDIATTTAENNYNCGGMVGIDYSKPGAQAFVNSWADEFASWGVDYVKIDGVGTPDIPDVRAWSDGLRQTGRPIHLELSNSLDINNASVWQQYSNGWRTGGDIECYCGPNGSSYPLTRWSSIDGRFDQVANWAPYGGPGGFNDYDSLEVGNGADDGLTLDERKTQMSLWSLAASPLILGTDLTNLDKTDLSLLKNRDVLAVDQDSIDAKRITSTGTTQVFAKLENANTAVVGLFNTGGAPQVVSTTASALGLPAGTDYTLDDLWAHQRTESAGTIAASVPSHGVALYRVTLDKHTPSHTPPSVVVDLTGLTAMTAGTPGTATLSFTDNGRQPAYLATLGLQLPSGWKGHPTSRSVFPTVASGKTVRTTFALTAPTPTALFQTSIVTGRAVNTSPALVPQRSTVAEPVTTSPPVSAAYRTFSSATDAPASFGQLGQQFGISGAGADLYSSTDAYSTIYSAGAVGTTATVDTEVTSQTALAGYGKAGILVRNSITGSGTTPEGVILFESPSGGIQLEWANNGGDFIDSVTPPNGTIPATLPVHLKLQRTGSTYTGYYSVDDKNWTKVGSATLTGQADTQDAGMFVTSHTSGTPAQVVFNGFGVSADATPPPLGPTSYEAESSANTIAGGASVSSCDGCSGGSKVGFVGNGGTLTFNDIAVSTAGDYAVTIYYTNGPPARQADMTVNGGTPQTLSFTATADFNTVGALTLTLPLNAGDNTIEFANPTAYAPDFDRITVASQPS
jgi:hypothetical protein